MRFKPSYFSVVIQSITLLSISTACNIVLAEEGGAVEEVVVTGSRIQRADLEESAPVISFSSEEIKNSGAATLSDFLSNSANLNAGLPTSENMTLSQMPGVRSIDYRGVGQEYVLILLNGRRVAKNPVTQSVDINQLPTAAIERVEILSSGRSAIYGADAVSGVINIITKKKFDGFNVETFLGQSSKGDGEQYSFSVVNGFNQANTSGIFSFDYFKQEAVNGADRDMSKSTIKKSNDERSSYGPYTNIAITSNEVTRRFTDPNCPESNLMSNEEGDVCLYDFADQYQAVPESERFGMFADIGQEISDTQSANLQLRYNYNKSTTKNAASPFSSSIKVNENNINAVKNAIGGGQSLQSLRDGIKSGDSVQFKRRFNEVGKRVVETEGHTYEGVFLFQVHWKTSPLII
jgi:iron complex outermembrane receptor protein